VALTHRCQSAAQRGLTAVLWTLLLQLIGLRLWLLLLLQTRRALRFIWLLLPLLSLLILLIPLSLLPLRRLLLLLRETHQTGQQLFGQHADDAEQCFIAGREDRDLRSMIEHLRHGHCVGSRSGSALRRGDVSAFRRLSGTGLRNEARLLLLRAGLLGLRRGRLLRARIGRSEEALGSG
jgi:hypothetical protein